MTVSTPKTDWGTVLLLCRRHSGFHPKQKFCIIVYAGSPSTQEVEEEGSVVQGQPGLLQFQANMGYIGPCLKKVLLNRINNYHSQAQGLEFLSPENIFVAG